MLHPGDVLRSSREALGGEKTRRQLEVVAGSPHRHGERLPAHPDLERLLDGDRVHAGLGLASPADVVYGEFLQRRGRVLAHPGSILPATMGRCSGARRAPDIDPSGRGV